LVHQAAGACLTILRRGCSPQIASFDASASTMIALSQREKVQGSVRGESLKLVAGLVAAGVALRVGHLEVLDAQFDVVDVDLTRFEERF
jgi:hypothetical protein